MTLTQSLLKSRIVEESGMSAGMLDAFAWSCYFRGFGDLTVAQLSETLSVLRRAQAAMAPAEPVDRVHAFLRSFA
jgi:hypothetical protein